MLTRGLIENLLLDYFRVTNQSRAPLCKALLVFRHAHPYVILSHYTHTPHLNVTCHLSDRRRSSMMRSSCCGTAPPICGTTTSSCELSWPNAARSSVGAVEKPRNASRTPRPRSGQGHQPCHDVCPFSSSYRGHCIDSLLPLIAMQPFLSLISIVCPFWAPCPSLSTL